MLACVTPRIASANCAADDPGGSKTAAARVSAEQTCASMNPAMGCTTAPNHGAYVSCIGGAAKKCAARSACGNPGFVTCCTTNKKGATSCKIKNSATACSGTAGTCGTCCGDGPPLGSGPTSPAG